MDRTFVATAVAAALLVAGGIGAGALLSGTGAFDEPLRVDPALTQFSAGDAACVAEPVDDTSAQLTVSDDSTYLSLDRNVTVPGVDYSVGNASFERVGLANYTLSMASVSVDRRGSCDETTRVPVRASVQVPHSEGEPFRITLVHDGDRIAILRNDPEGLTVEDAS